MTVGYVYMDVLFSFCLYLAIIFTGLYLKKILECGYDSFLFSAAVRFAYSWIRNDIPCCIYGLGFSWLP